MIPRRLMSTRATWLAGICTAAAAVAYMAFYFIPNMRSIRLTMADLESKHTYILDAQKTLARGEQLQAELDETVGYVDKHCAKLLRQDELPVLYLKISHITKTRGVRTTKFEPQPAISYDGMQKVAIGLGVTGSFANIHHMLCDVEALDAQIWVDDLKLHGDRQNGKSAECELVLVVFVDNPEKSD